MLYPPTTVPLYNTWDMSPPSACLGCGFWRGPNNKRGSGACTHCINKPNKASQGLRAELRQGRVVRWQDGTYMQFEGHEWDSA